MQSPWMFRHVDEIFYGCKGPGLSRRQIVERYCDYVEKLQETHRMVFSESFQCRKVETEERCDISTALHVI